MEHVLVLGATSAVATEVVKLHAARGDRLHLVARNPAKLATVVAACGHAPVTSAVADFSDLERNDFVIRACIEALDGRLDRVLIAHGDLGDQLESERSFATAHETLRVNFLSVVALLIPLANHMELHRAGRIGVITSVAGDRGRPRNYTYGSAKGALNIYLQGLRTRLVASKIAVTTLKLGPVDTPMTRDHAKNVLFGKSEPVARGIVAAMDARTPEAYVPSFWRVIMPVVRNAPEIVFQTVKGLGGR